MITDQYHAGVVYETQQKQVELNRTIRELNNSLETAKNLLVQLSFVAGLGWMLVFSLGGALL